MTTFLHRLGRSSFRRRRLVAGLWVALLLGLAVSASTLSGPYASQFSIPGSESQKAVDTLASRFPQAQLDAATANVVIAAPRGERLDSGANRAATQAVLALVRTAPHVEAVTDPFAVGSLSPDGRICVARATYDLAPLDVSKGDQSALRATAGPGTRAGLQVEFSGTAAQTRKRSGGIGELLGVVVAAIVLLAMFGSVTAAGLPLVTAFLAVGIGATAITTLTGFITLSNTTPVLGLMLGLAVGIDYALFIMSRYRDELLRGRDGAEAAGRAVATAGSAVVFAGLTVIIALVGLLAVNVPFLAYMGLGAAGTVVVAVLVALTLLPALLGFAGRKVLGRRALPSEGDPRRPTRGHAWAMHVARRPVPVLVVALLGLGALAVPALSLKTALPDEGSLSKDDTNRRACDLLSEAFGAGSNGPLVVRRGHPGRRGTRRPSRRRRPQGDAGRCRRGTGCREPCRGHVPTDCHCRQQSRERADQAARQSDQDGGSTAGAADAGDDRREWRDGPGGRRDRATGPSAAHLPAAGRGAGAGAAHRCLPLDPRPLEGRSRLPSH